MFNKTYMKKNFFICVMMLMTLGSGVAFAADVADYNVVPLPQKVTLLERGSFELTKDVIVAYPQGDEAMKQNAQFLIDYLKDVTGIELASTTDKVKGAAIRLVLDKKVVGDEAYTLTVDGKRGVTIAASTPCGVFYGIQTLRKSLPVVKTDKVELPAVVINDAPAFGHRGMMLDCSRHFFSVDFVKKFIDLIAMHNMNRFHWHLTDDQGWRIEIKKYPKLATIGSKRAGTVVGSNSTIDDGVEYGAYYTQKEAREIVEYARKRYITVIPEIDMPGHMLAALAAYPELGCTGGPYEVGKRWGIYTDVLCMGNEKVYTFCEDVLAEVMDIFPSTFIHIGGDETPIYRWSNCPKCKKLMAEHNLVPKTAQGYFTNRIEKFVNSKGRRIIGWDEILEGEINQSATIMCWRDVRSGAMAAAKGHDVILSPTSNFYFDYCQDAKNSRHEPTLCGGDLSVERVYSFIPTPDSLSAETRSHFLGIQANLWTEYVPTERIAEYQILPRMAALADVNWTNGKKDFAGFKTRLDRLVKLYDHYGLIYAKHLWPDTVLPWYETDGIELKAEQEAKQKKQ